MSMIPKSGHRFSEKIMLNKPSMITLWSRRLIAAVAALFFPAVLFAQDGVDWMSAWSQLPSWVKTILTNGPELAGA